MAPSENLLNFFKLSSTNENDEFPKKKKTKESRKLIESSEETVYKEVQTNVFAEADENMALSAIQTNDDPEPSISSIPKLIKYKPSAVINDFLNADPSEFENIENSVISPAKKKEERYEFLVDVRDKNKRRKGDSGYDPTKLYIPNSFYSKFTPFEKQFWDIKSEYYDTVIFFKKGKFYELYEDDADIASRLFDLKVTERVNMKMAGFPESSYQVWESKFLKNGYKIGRVEQSENSIGKKIREISEIKEKISDCKVGVHGDKRGSLRTGDKIIARELCEVITQGTIYNNEFFSESHSQYLGVILENGPCSCENPDSSHKYNFSILLYEASLNKMIVKSFCDTLDLNGIKTLFVQYNIREVIINFDLKIPKGIIRHKPISGISGISRKGDFSTEGEFNCYSALVNYFILLRREMCLDRAVIAYFPVVSDFMELDGSTLTNLDILINNYDHSENYTLFKAINYCSTPFGARLLRKWLVNPFNSLVKINERRNLTKIFSEDPDGSLDTLIRDLVRLGDVERFHGKLSSATPALRDLCGFVDSLSRVSSALNSLGLFLDSSSKISKLNLIFDHIKISSEFSMELNSILANFKELYKIVENEIIPGNKNDELYILESKKIEISKCLEAYLDSLKEKLGEPLCWKSVGKEIYQIEASSTVKMPPEFFVVSTTKGTVRYYSKNLKDLITQFVENDERIFQSRNSILRRTIDYFIQYNSNIHKMISYISEIDCLISFSKFNRLNNAVEPELFHFSDSTKKFVIKNMGSPIYRDYIKNSFCPLNSISLITGPNMGGKSSFLRSICLNIILAQMGMGVICDYACMPIFDKIFTRIGAADSLAKGESTFMVEMNETSKILNTCTSSSFVIIDELGRGTSTKDGEAIAKAVLNYFKKMKCYVLFATHFHNLVNHFESADKLFPEYIFENEDIVFLYKMKEGICNDSHGIHVAKLANIPDHIIRRSTEIRNEILKDGSHII